MQPPQHALRVGLRIRPCGIAEVAARQVPSCGQSGSDTVMKRKTADRYLHVEAPARVDDTVDHVEKPCGVRTNFPYVESLRG